MFDFTSAFREKAHMLYVRGLSYLVSNKNDRGADMTTRVQALTAAFERGEFQPDITDDSTSGSTREDDRRAVIKQKAQDAVRLRKNSRDRTHIGSPKVRDSFTAEDLDLFNNINDGFPLGIAGSTLENIPHGDSNDEVFNDVPDKEPTVTDEVRTRSRSLPDIQVNKVNFKAKGLSKPNFLQKLLKAGKSKGKSSKLSDAPTKGKSSGLQLLVVNSLQKMTDPVGIVSEENRLSDINEEQIQRQSDPEGTLCPTETHSCHRQVNSNGMSELAETVCDRGHKADCETDSRGDNIEKIIGSGGDNMQFRNNRGDNSGGSENSETSEQLRSDNHVNSNSGNEAVLLKKSPLEGNGNYNFSEDGAYSNQMFKRRTHIYESIGDEGSGCKSPQSEHNYENVEFSSKMEQDKKTNTPSTYSCMTQSIIEFDWDSDSFSDGCSDQSDGEESSDTRSSKTNSTVSEPMTKRHKIACEILSTEQAYVETLQLIDQVFHFKIDLENRASPMFPQEVVQQMFGNVNSLFHLHQDFLLQPLEKRLLTWSENECIGDIMLKISPFLKMYTEYIKNFDQSMYLIDLYTDKSRRFASLLEEIQKLPECGMLTLQHHLLGPIQRVPRYEMLMKDYLKHLPEGSPDRADTVKALELVTKAATHANEAMRKSEKFRKLLEINGQLGDDINLITPTRELIKEGPIQKVSAKSGDLQDRYIFLFNDMMLVCSIQGRKSYKMRARLDIDGMVARNSDDEENPHTFHVQSKQKSFLFHTGSLEESGEWQVAIWRCVSEMLSRQESFTNKQQPANQFLLEDELGIRPPYLIKDSAVSVCMLCNRAFSAFRKRHNCRVCGIIVCASCSGHKIALAYDNNKINRVCKKCFKILRDKGGSTVNSEDDLDSDFGKKGILQVKANDTSLISGYLWMSMNRGRSWEKRWFSVHNTFVMYMFKGDQDTSAVSSVPLPGFHVCTPGAEDAIQQEHVFKLFHKTNIFFYQAENHNSLNRWINILEKVTKAELPSCDVECEDPGSDL